MYWAERRQDAPPTVLCECETHYAILRPTSVVDQLEPRLVLVPDVELVRARRLVRQVLIAVNGAARNVHAVERAAQRNT